LVNWFTGLDMAAESGKQRNGHSRHKKA